MRKYLLIVTLLTLASPVAAQYQSYQPWMPKGHSMYQPPAPSYQQPFTQPQQPFSQPTYRVPEPRRYEDPTHRGFYLPEPHNYGYGGAEPIYH